MNNPVEALEGCQHSFKSKTEQNKSKQNVELEPLYITKETAGVAIRSLVCGAADL